ncbi:hypothetical protein HTG_06355 [Natrinema mahii]|nr:hypothetical protein HTG_06355 [Natrinema mahii]
MSEKDNNRSDRKACNRRQALTAIGSGAITVPSLAVANVTADSDWNCNSDCPQEKITSEKLNIPDPAGEEREGSVAIHWKSSGFSSEVGDWIHVFSVSGGASSTSDITGGHIYGQHYKLETSDGDLKPSTQSERHGQYPCDDEDEAIPGWAQPLMEASIGTINVGASWFLAVDEFLRESLGHRPDGFEIFAGGFEYGDMATSLFSPRAWGQCGFFHRFELEGSMSSHVDFTLGFCHHDSSAATNWTDLEGTLDFFGDDAPGILTQTVSSPHPEEMPSEMWKEYGIKNVSDTQIRTQAAGSKATPIDYIATKSPLSIKNVEITERKEEEMDEPYSDRYRTNLEKPAPY